MKKKFIYIVYWMLQVKLYSCICRTVAITLIENDYFYTREMNWQTLYRVAQKSKPLSWIIIKSY